MNPELQRNLWLEASPFRLALILGLLLLVFSATSIAPRGLMTTPGTALTLYWFFAVLWGTRSAALSVVAEIRERTWDGQKLSAIGPWEMVWGKLFGSTAANWFGALLCLAVLLATGGGGLVYGLILLAMGVFAQAVALLSSLVLIRRNTGNWRLDTFLCQVAGIGAAFSFYSLWSSTPAFLRNGIQSIIWWGYGFNLSGFYLVSLLLFLAWALIGCWRAMRSELRFANGPYVWLGYLFYISVYSAGFQSWLARPMIFLFATENAMGKLMLASIALIASTYSMVFLEPKDTVRFRWLREQIFAGRLYRAFLALDCWMLSYGAAFIVMLALTVVSVAGGMPIAFALTNLAMLGFLTRDVAIFVLIGGWAGGKGDFAVLAILGTIFLLVPSTLNGLGLHALEFLFLPTKPGVPGVIAAWVEAAAFAYLALKRATR